MMASALDRLNAAAAKRGGAAPADVPEVLDDPQVPKPAPVRVDDVRQTVNLSPRRHDGLSLWVDEASVALGLPIGKRGVTKQDTLAAAVTAILTDEMVSRRVREIIKKAKAAARGES